MEKQANPLRTLDPDYSYSVKEAAQLLNVADETVRRIFEVEEGVLIFITPRKHRRSRVNRIIRIPGWVLQRYLERVRVA
jgi:excisionase family DNA binding protein